MSPADFTIFKWVIGSVSVPGINQVSSLLHRTWTQQDALRGFGGLLSL